MYPSKTIKGKKHEVTVHTEDLTNRSGVPTVIIRATVGDTVIERTHTLMAVDGAHALPEPGTVQAALDRARVKAARAAEVHHELKSQLSSLV